MENKGILNIMTNARNSYKQNKKTNSLELVLSRLYIVCVKNRYTSVLLHHFHKIGDNNRANDSFSLIFFERFPYKSSVNSLDTSIS